MNKKLKQQVAFCKWQWEGTLTLSAHGFVLYACHFHFFFFLFCICAGVICTPVRLVLLFPGAAASQWLQDAFHFEWHLNQENSHQFSPLKCRRLALLACRRGEAEEHDSHLKVHAHPFHLSSDRKRGIIWKRTRESQLGSGGWICKLCVFHLWELPLTQLTIDQICGGRM